MSLDLKTLIKARKEEKKTRLYWDFDTRHALCFPLLVNTEMGFVQKKEKKKIKRRCDRAEEPAGCWRPLTCRLMKLDVVSEDVLPSERLKRLLRLGNFLGSCEEKTHVTFLFHCIFLFF